MASWVHLVVVVINLSATCGILILFMPHDLGECNGTWIVVLVNGGLCILAGLMDIANPLNAAGQEHLCKQTLLYFVPLSTSMFTVFWTLVTRRRDYMCTNPNTGAGMGLSLGVASLDFVWLAAVILVATSDICCCQDNTPLQALNHNNNHNHAAPGGQGEVVAAAAEAGIPVNIQEAELSDNARMEEEQIQEATRASLQPQANPNHRDYTEADVFLSMSDVPHPNVIAGATQSSRTELTIKDGTSVSEVVGDGGPTLTVVTDRVVLDDSYCVICSQPFFDARADLGVKVVNNCQHKFHASCIMRWVLDRRQNTCPLCRGPVISPSPSHISHTAVTVHPAL